jgi:hypothetical protein
MCDTMLTDSFGRVAGWKKMGLAAEVLRLM